MTKKPQAPTPVAEPPKDRQWEVIFDEAFKAEEFRSMDKEQRLALLAAADALEDAGPSAGRPLIGTLDNPKHPNMKELRYEAHEGTQIWRAAFAFDPKRNAIVLMAGDKQGTEKEKFYKNLLRVANKRFDKHLDRLAKEEAKAKAQNKDQPKPKAAGKSGKAGKRK